MPSATTTHQRPHVNANRRPFAGSSSNERSSRFSSTYATRNSPVADTLVYFSLCNTDRLTLRQDLSIAQVPSCDRARRHPASSSSSSPSPPSHPRLTSPRRPSVNAARRPDRETSLSPSPCARCHFAVLFCSRAGLPPQWRLLRILPAVWLAGRSVVWSTLSSQGGATRRVRPHGII